MAACQAQRNIAQKGIEIKFPSYPGENIIETLKQNGFRYSRYGKLWYTTFTEEKWTFAQQFCDQNPESFVGIGNEPSDMDSGDTAPAPQYESELLTFEQKVFINYLRMSFEKTIYGNIKRMAVFYDKETGIAYFILLRIRPYKNSGDEYIKTEKIINIVDADFWNYLGDDLKKEAYVRTYVIPKGKLVQELGYGILQILEKPTTVKVENYGIDRIPRSYQGKKIDFKNLKLSKYGRYSNKYLLSLEILLGKIGIANTMWFDGSDDSHRFNRNAPVEHFSKRLNDNILEGDILGGFDDVRKENNEDAFSAGNSAHTYKLKYISDKVDLYGDTPKPILKEATPEATATTDKATATTDKATAQKFFKSAESMRNKGQKWIDSHRNALTNTPKRQREYNGGKIEADSMLEKALIYEAIGKAYENGTLPPVLKDISPVLADNDLEKFMKSTGSNGYYSIYVTDKRNFEKHPNNYKGDISEQWAAIQELLGGKKTKTPEQEKEEQIKAKIDELRFTKIAGFFPTPETIIKDMIRYARLSDGDKVLEPSAGIGSIADLIEKEYPSVQIDVCEKIYSLREILELKGYNVVGTDTLELKGQYDAILMNPPFEAGQDVEHVTYCYNNLLKPGGTLVAIMSRSFTFNKQKKFEDFRNLLESIDAYNTPLPDGAFNDPREAFRQTGVATNMVVLEKPQADMGDVKIVAPEPTPSVPEPQKTENPITQRIRETLISNGVEFDENLLDEDSGVTEFVAKNCVKYYGACYPRIAIDKKLFMDTIHGSQEFPLSDVHKAIKAFMEEYNKLRAIEKTEAKVIPITDFIKKNATPSVNTPESIYEKAKERVLKDVPYEITTDVPMSKWFTIAYINKDQYEPEKPIRVIYYKKIKSWWYSVIKVYADWKDIVPTLSDEDMKERSGTNLGYDDEGNDNYYRALKNTYYAKHFYIIYDENSSLEKLNIASIPYLKKHIKDWTDRLNNIELYAPRYNKENVKQIISEYENQLLSLEQKDSVQTLSTIENNDKEKLEKRIALLKRTLKFQEGEDKEKLEKRIKTLERALKYQ